MMKIDEIENLVTTMDDKEILKTYTKKDLTIMYMTVHGGTKPLSYYKKSDMLYMIKDYFRNKRRNEALSHIVV